MHCWLTIYSVYGSHFWRCAKLCALIAKLEIAVWHHREIEKLCASYDYVGSLRLPIIIKMNHYAILHKSKCGKLIFFGVYFSNESHLLWTSGQECL